MIKDIKTKINSLEFEKRPFINGEYVESISKERINKISPADGSDISGLRSCNLDDIDKAVQAANQSFKSRIWCDRDPKDKKAILSRLADLIEENIEELALLDTLETGRCIKNYYNDSIPKAIAAIRWFSEAVDKYYGKASQMRKNTFAIITNEPIGVVGLITPWNDPLVVSSWKFTPALLMGNSVVIKPAEQSSFSILRVAYLAQEAGIPDGVFNVVPGYGDIAGKALALHQNVQGIFFTGSSDVGKKILQYAGQSNMKKVSLECGGKSPLIISNKCNRFDEAAKVLAKNIFYNQGQICSAPSRLIINKNIKDQFVDILLKEVKKYIPGDPYSFESDVGCLVSMEQKNRIIEYIEMGKVCGCKILNYEFDSNKLPLNRPFVLPVIFDNVDSSYEFSKEEIFGPVLSIIEYKELKKAIDIANNTRYGLAASIWTDDIDEAYQSSRLLQAGIIHINSYGEDDNTVPFGGFKESGIGKDKSFFAFDEYSSIKTTWYNFNTLA